MLLHNPDSSNYLVAMILAPAAAFSLPWLLLKRLPEDRRKKRLPAMLGSSFPIVILTVLAATFFTPEWRRGPAHDTVHDSTNRERLTGDWTSLMLRVGMMSVGAFGLLWLSGIIGEKLYREESDDEDANLLGTEGEHAAT